MHVHLPDGLSKVRVDSGQAEPSLVLNALRIRVKGSEMACEKSRKRASKRPFVVSLGRPFQTCMSWVATAPPELSAAGPRLSIDVQAVRADNLVVISSALVTACPTMPD